ncbi:MAG TPA: DUF4920 domain-containing protein [Gemmatimonadaceae bacterium]|jgi:hypothetical protein
MTLIRSATIALAFVALTATAQAQGKQYGKPLTLKEKTPISKILQNPHAYHGQKVQVEGAIIEVCEERGCWIKIASDKPLESIRFKVDDGVIVFPLDAKGKKATVEGEVQVKMLTAAQALAQAKEMAKERGTKVDESKYTKDVMDVQIKGEGARIQ